MRTIEDFHLFGRFDDDRVGRFGKKRQLEVLREEFIDGPPFRQPEVVIFVGQMNIAGRIRAFMDVVNVPDKRKANFRKVARVVVPNRNEKLWTWRDRCS